MQHYKTLEVDSKASIEVITAAHRALAIKYNGDEKNLKIINNAYDILKSKTKRRKFDNPPAINGKICGNYRILGKIAEGGFGVTYKGEHIHTGYPVCIKHASEISAHDEQTLIEEARSCWDLRHWGIPCMRDIIYLPDKSVALVMSFIEGKNISEIVELHKSGLDPEHVAWIADRVINTLKYLHYNGVVHGDVKPQNIIVQSESHTAVLVDYGLSVIKPKMKDVAKGYTPYFAAPEQLQEKPPLPETDFYGLGMSMIFALGGDVEFVKVPGHTPDELCKFIKNLVRREVRSRPNWKTEDLCETIRKVREKDFGRSSSFNKPLSF